MTTTAIVWNPDLLSSGPFFRGDEPSAVYSAALELAALQGSAFVDAPVDLAAELKTLCRRDMSARARRVYVQAVPTDEQLRALREVSDATGNDLFVELCDRAMQGDALARESCGDALLNERLRAQAGGVA